MRASQLRFVSSSALQLARASNQPIPAGSGLSAVQRATASILPPIQLYRRLLRSHRHLNADMRTIGDAYIKDEFHRHRDTDNPLHIVGFLSSWKVYLDQLEIEQGAPSGFRGRRLEPELLEKMSDEQIYQVYDLMHATRDVYDPEKAQATPPSDQGGASSKKD